MKRAIPKPAERLFAPSNCVGLWIIGPRASIGEGTSGEGRCGGGGAHLDLGRLEGDHVGDGGGDAGHFEEWGLEVVKGGECVQEWRTSERSLGCCALATLDRTCC